MPILTKYLSKILHIWGGLRKFAPIKQYAVFEGAQ